jgi:2-oxoisovalerate dehydrogenase E1 component
MVKDSRFIRRGFDWREVAKYALTARAIDLIEEQELYPSKKIIYQFSSKGHELAQVLLGSLMISAGDGISAYYRSRPLLLTQGLTIEDAFAGPLGLSGSYSDGRDIGVVCNLPSQGRATVLPMAGDVGSQYTPAAGWAQSIRYHSKILKRSEYESCISLVFGGEGSVATNGFWSALTIATTLGLPMIFVVEDNGYAISVPSDRQTPGGNIADNLRSFKNLHIIEGDGAEPADASSCVSAAVRFVRNAETPVLLRLRVPRLSGHSGQDTQAYKSEELLAEERERDPIPKLKNYLVPSLMDDAEWAELEQEVESDVRRGLAKALSREAPNPERIYDNVFSQVEKSGIDRLQSVGGVLPTGFSYPQSSQTPTPEGVRINMLAGIRKTLSSELRVNPSMLVFGEDVGPKGGVHAATLDLQEEFGFDRVFDTSLSEEGIIGRAVGMAYAGLTPVTEIQFRKYADPATEQLNNCGTVRWRTNNRFAAPITVRMPGGFSKYVGDPWHSVSGEAVWLHQCGWEFAIPSTVEDAVGLLRTSIRSNNPSIFFEHRALLDAPEARGMYPGDDYVVPFGVARIVRAGSELTVVSWGAMVHRCQLAADELNRDVEIIDLRTLRPWDRSAVMASVEKTKRCVIVHEDTKTVGFGAEIAAYLAENAFYHLDAPISRVATRDIPIPYNLQLMEHVVPDVGRIAAAFDATLSF